MTSPALTIALMIAGWFAVAVAMLWGMLRIARRHHHAPAAGQEPEIEQKTELRKAKFAAVSRPAAFAGHRHALTAPAKH
jgi:hypothetical protein